MEESFQISANDIINMNRDQFVEYLTILNKKFRNITNDEDVMADVMMAGELVSPTKTVKERILSYLCSNMKLCQNNKDCAAMVYYTLINLHMFSDGNGRVSRFIFDTLAGNSVEDNIEYYYHRNGPNINTNDHGFEEAKGILDPSLVNEIPDNILINKLTFIPKEFKEKYSWITTGANNKRKKIDDILPSNVLEELSSEEKSNLEQVLMDSGGCGLTPAGIAMFHICSKKGELDQWAKLAVNNLPIEEQENLGITGRFVFPIFKHPELINNWTSEDFRTIISVGNEIKYERLKSIIDIFSSPELLLDKKTGKPYKDSIIFDKLNAGKYAEQIVEAMANGQFDINGQPIIENQDIIPNNKTMGFAKVWVLTILTAIASVVILIIGTLLNTN